MSPTLWWNSIHASQSLRAVSNDPLLAISGWLIGLLALVSSFWFFLRTRQSKVLTFAKRTTVLVRGLQSTFTDVQVRYRNAVIPNLSVTKIAIWNAGTVAIRDNDIATLDPLRITATQGVAILDAQIIAANCTANNFRLAQGESVGISFEFARKKEGVVIQVLHTGSKGSDVQMKGSLKDAPRLKRYSGLVAPPPFPSVSVGNSRWKPGKWFFCFFIFAMALLAFYYAVSSVRSFPQHRILAYFLAAACTLFGVVYSIMAYRTIKSGIPSGLAAFSENNDTVAG